MGVFLPSNLRPLYGFVRRSFYKAALKSGRVARLGVSLSDKRSFSDNNFKTSREGRLHLELHAPRDEAHDRPHLAYQSNTRGAP